ncbi:MAG: type II toxin-antitoxin system VapC family toxin [Pirellulales bacterium]
MIFVDTGAWFAVFSRRDVSHSAATTFIRSIVEPLVTTDYVVDETLTLLRVRGERRRAIAFGDRVLNGGWAGIVRVDESDFAAAWTLFRSFQDKDWSFTDCTSRVVMERLNVQTAFAFDEHFRQFGNVNVLP